MKNVLKYAVAAIFGAFCYGVCVCRDVDSGNVVYENDEMYVKSSPSKSHGWSYAEVHWKNPVENDD